MDANSHHNVSNFKRLASCHLAGTVGGCLSGYAWSQQHWPLLGTGIALCAAAAVAVTWCARHSAAAPAPLLSPVEPRMVEPEAGPARSTLHHNVVTFSADELMDRRQRRMQYLQSQAGFIGETVLSLNQLTSAVLENAQNAQNASKLAATASEVAAQGGSAVSAAVGTMNKLSDSAQKIADITTVIDSIAFQTNILALNAAVEAARAGDQGKGFAVVAAEVRNLAHRSAEAAKEIKNLIQTSVTQIDAGAGLVNQAGKTMEEVLNSVHRVTTIMHNIANDASLQSVEVGNVRKSVQQMQEATAESIKTVEVEIAQVQRVAKAPDAATPTTTAEDSTALPPPRRSQDKSAVSLLADKAATPSAARPFTSTPAPARSRARTPAVTSLAVPTKKKPAGRDTPPVRAAAAASPVVSPVPIATKPSSGSHDPNDHWVEF